MRARFHFTVTVTLALGLLIVCAVLLGALLAPRGERYFFIETNYVRGDARYPRIVVLDHSTGRAVLVYRATQFGLQEQRPPWEAIQERAVDKAGKSVTSLAAQGD